MLRNFLIVGGASAYAPGLVSSLIRESHRHDLELIRLFDIAEERLDIVARLCRRLSEAAGKPFRVEATTDQARAVEEIDILLNSSRPGGFECRQIDETLPLEFDIPGQETVGPGGFFFACRSIPAALELADHVARKSPEAIWLNYTNPTNIVGQALHDHTDLNVISLCDQFDEDLHALADALGFPKNTDYQLRCSGLNHATWYRDIRISGEAIGERAYDAQPPEYYDEEHKRRFLISAEMARSHDGIWPNSYLPYYEAPSQFVELAKQRGTRTEAILQGLNDYYKHFREEAEKSSPELKHYRGSSGFGDMAADVIAALSSDEPTELVLNIPNRGLNDEFDDATVVEAFVSVSRAGVQRNSAPPIPEKARPLLDQLEIYQRRSAQAAAGGDRDEMVRALAENPLVDDSSTAGQLLRRADDAYGGALPQFSTNL